jgi:hypothetical protein
MDQKGMKEFLVMIILLIVSFKDWLMFVSKIERKEPNYYKHPNGIHGPSGCDAVKNSNTKTQELRSQPVRTPPNAPRQKTGESDVALEPSGRPILPSGRPVLKILFPVFLIARPDEPTYRPDSP